ncbi:glucosylceramidase [Vineibacter terrae]|uniref:Glucosylceramidase n=2 Tax=Vineibacter terrae TaxID=2586908 RepID=A0A5C8P6W7_9HYPH|nr:glucosylceramidase [Vineibacter terrae]
MQPVAFSRSLPQDALPTIEIDDNRTFQPIEGFGFALTGGSAYLLAGLPEADRADLLEELFGLSDASVGLSCLRLSIGASDLGRRDCTYWDLPPGTADPDLSRFNLAACDPEVVPVLQQILRINPAVKIIASPWTAPPWMKSNGSFVAGSLKPECYSAYARYFVKYVEAMRGHGIHVSAVTPQNEPHNPKNEPSMVMAATEQAEFIKGYLGPALRKGAPETEILCWDHNCDEPDYPLTVLGDAEARAYIGGVAWHLYSGSPEAMSVVRARYPAQKVYFTEQWVSAREDFMGALRWHARNVIIGALRNWSRTALEWNLASDPEYALHTPNGAVGAMGGVTIGATIKRNPGYYLMAHSARFIRPESVRVYSSEVDQLPNVTCLTPDSRMVMVVMNDAEGARRFRIQHQGAYATLELGAGDVATLRWNVATVLARSERAGAGRNTWSRRHSAAVPPMARPLTAHHRTKPASLDQPEDQSIWLASRSASSA